MLPPLTIVLSQEVPVVQIETRPFEQVTVTVETSHEQQQVSVTIGTEQAELSTADQMQRPAGRPT